MSTKKNRYDRLCQQKHRGSKRSYLTEIEDLKICLAWEAGELSEGQVAKALGYDRVTCRAIAQDAIEDARRIYTELISP